jgi:hypothetical protein
MIDWYNRRVFDLKLTLICIFQFPCQKLKKRGFLQIYLKILNRKGGLKRHPPFKISSISNRLVAMGSSKGQKGSFLPTLCLFSVK